MSARPDMWRYRDLLPLLPAEASPVTLGEGGTPLLPSGLLDGVDLYLKDETRNPTGSHKDRALALAATHARFIGAKCMVVVSAGSTGISNAAYATRAGLPSIAVVGAGIPAARLAPLSILGSRIISVDAPIDRLFGAVDEIARRRGLYHSSTMRRVNAIQANAGRTIAYEIADALGCAPDLLVMPAGGGGTLAAVHAGFADLLARGHIKHIPRLIAVVSANYDNLRVGFRAGPAAKDGFFKLPLPTGGPTVLNKIAHDHAPDGPELLEAVWATKGDVKVATEEEAISAVSAIGGKDGFYVEPSSAVVWPALQQLRAEGAITPGMKVVAVMTGSGFRETMSVIDHLPSLRAPIELTALEAALTDVAGDASN